MPWTSSGSTASSCGMCGITNERTLRLPDRAQRARRADRLGRQQVQHAAHLLDDDGAGADALRRHQVQLLQAPVGVRDLVDGGGQRRHVESVSAKRD